MSTLEIAQMEYPEVEFTVMDDFDDCIIGVVERYGAEPCLAYDHGKVIEKMVKRDGMTLAEAQEFYEYNQLGAYMGETAPVFIVVMKLSDVEGRKE